MQTHLLANTIIDRCIGRSTRIRPMKLQKLMFFTCGLHIAYDNEWIIDSEFRAYPYGPVEEESYNYFSKFGGGYITKYMTQEQVISSENKKIYDSLNIILNTYLSKSDLELSDITHEKGSPWFDTWCKGKGPRSLIDKIKIRDYYQKEIENEKFPKER